MLSISHKTLHQSPWVMRFRDRSAFESRSGGIVYASQAKAVGASPRVRSSRALGFSALNHSVVILAGGDPLDK